MAHVNLVTPRLGFLKLDVQVDLTQDLGDLFTLWPVADIGHCLPIVMRRIGNLKGLTGAACCRLLYLGNNLVEGVMIIIEEDYHPWLTKVRSDVLFRAYLRLCRHKSTSSVRL
jgi:hypothetical protein